MFDIGFWELLLVAIMALVVVGPERLPKLVRVCGLWIGRANTSLQTVKNDIAKELRAEEVKQALKTLDDYPDLNETIDINESIPPKPSPEKAIDQVINKQRADDGKG